MGELDYQTALLLQHQFEQEHKGATHLRDPDEDFVLAVQLQEQFERETAVDRPKDNLVYDYKKKPSGTLNTSKSLVDPSWEVIDPTPDIHILFIAFNEKFFWSKLLAVTVSWSKRMTSCAGICSYQGRGGLCRITLSEPLLKLRPRKDLVETLLHEMIHAYLFVTHNNRDRSGHGPEFHKHMYRINAATGTNITVYHDFYDEVRLYKQHVWRCDGPCQTLKPYFGTVRRATNRAPGPNDFWWGEHSRNCGGTFIKVSEPEKIKKSKAETKSSTKKPTSNTSDIRKFVTGSNTNSQLITNNKSNNIHTISNTTASNSKISTVIPSKVNNINGFTNLNGTVTLPPKTVTKNKNKSEKTSTSSQTKEITPFAGTGFSLGSNNKKNEDYTTVRNHWANKFASPTLKRAKTVENNDSTPPKVPKLNKSSTDLSVSCPVCNKKVSNNQLNDHLDICLESQNSCDTSHTKDCDNNLKNNNCIDLTFVDDNTKKCPVCEKDVHEQSYDTHVEKCLIGFYDKIDDQCAVPKEETTACLACNKNIVKSELNSHLDDCMNLSSVFDTSNVPIEGDNSQERTKYNCPICMKLVDERKMDDHLNKCLKDNDCGEDKVNFLDTFSSDDF